MPAVSFKYTIPAVGSGAAAIAAQTAQAFDTLLAVLAGETSPTHPVLPGGIPVGGAGFTVLRYTTDHNDGSNRRAALLRYPKLDRYDSFGQLLWMTNQDSADNPTILQFWPVFDANLYETFPRVSGGTAATSVIYSQGGWALDAGTTLDFTNWPAGGRPKYTFANFTGAGDEQRDGFLVYTGDQVYTLHIAASEYGYAVTSNTGTALDSYAYAEAREYDPIRLGRDIRIEGSMSSPWPVAIAAPTGVAIPAHLRVRCEGQNYDITFPNYGGGFTYTADEFAAWISRVGLGFFEGGVKDVVLPGNVKPVLRIPGDRPPAGEWSTERPSIAVLYQDPTLVAAGISFSIYSGIASAVAAGSPGTLRVNGIQWPTFNARVGGRVWNVTRDQGATIQGFATGLTQDDTLVLDTVPGPWAAGDTYYVLQGPEGHADGVGVNGGSYVGTLSTDETSSIVNGALRTLILNDKLGEAQTHYEVGQEVRLVNDGCAAVLDIGAIAPATWFIGDVLEVTAGIGLGTRAVVRAITATKLVVTTTRGAKNNGTPFKVVPFSVGDTVTRLDPITGLPTLTTGVIATRTTPGPNPLPTALVAPLGTSQIGQYGRARVTAKGQVNVAAGDYRTTLTLDLNAAEVNPNFDAFAACLVGLNAREKIAVSFTFSNNAVDAGSTPIIEDISTQPPDLRDQDLATQRRFEIQTNTGTANSPREPDHQASSLGMESFLFLFRRGYLLTDVHSILPHLKSVSARASFGGPSQYSTLRDDGDPNRPWLPVEIMNIANYGASITGATVWWACVGPGLNIQYP